MGITERRMKGGSLNNKMLCLLRQIENTYPKTTF